MKRSRVFSIVIVLLIILNFAIGRNVLVNFALGVVAYLIAMAARKLFRGKSVVLGITLAIVVLALPVLGYTLVWYLSFFKEIPNLVVSTSLGYYVGQNILYSIPSTIAGSIGDWIIEAIFG